MTETNNNLTFLNKFLSFPSLLSFKSLLLINMRQCEHASEWLGLGRLWLKQENLWGLYSEQVLPHPRL